jgi:hypothetical protein
VLPFFHIVLCFFFFSFFFTHGLFVQRLSFSFFFFGLFVSRLERSVSDWSFAVPCLVVRTIAAVVLRLLDVAFAGRASCV